MGTRRTKDDGDTTAVPAGSGAPAVTVASAPGAPARRLDERSVGRFLTDNPEFLAEFILANPQIWSRLPGMAARRPDGAIDLAGFLVGRLRGQIENLKTQQREIIDTARSNTTIQERVHKASLALLQCASLEQLVAVVSCDLTLLLDLDVAELVVEIDDRAAVPRCPHGIRLVAPGTVRRLLGPVAIRLEPVMEGDRQVFGPGAGLVESAALVRLDIDPPSPPALLALGSRRRHMFQPGMRTDLLAFLGRVMEHCLRQSLARGY